MQIKQFALLIGLLAGSFLSHGQAVAGKLEGIILQNDGGALRILDVVSYEKFYIPVTASTVVVRKNHGDIAVGDLKIGWFVEIEGNNVRVKNGRFQEVKFDGFQEHTETHERLIVDGQSVSLEESRLVIKKNYSGELKPGMKTKVKGTRQDDGTVKATEVVVEPNGTGILERESLREVADFIQQFDRKPHVIKDSSIQRYVRNVGERLVPDYAKREMEFRFYVIDNESINAFASRSQGSTRIRGSVYVTIGLLEVLENEAQLATVLGHEIAHITHEHLSRGAGKRLWTTLALSVAQATIEETLDGAGEIFAGIGLGLAGSALISGYSRNFEDQADRVGLRYMYEAGYDPMQAPRVWHVFTQHTNDQNKVANFFYGSHSTHIARKRNLFLEISQTYFDSVHSGLPDRELAYRENVLRYIATGDRSGLYESETTGSAKAAVSQYSGVLFVPWRTKSHRQTSSGEVFVQAVDKFAMLLQAKGVNLVDDDFFQRQYHEDLRIRRLASLTEDTEALPMSSVMSTARALGADSVLVLEVSRPWTKWIKMEAKCYDLSGNVLWEEVGEHGGGWRSKGSIEKSVQKLSDGMETRWGADCLNQFGDGQEPAP